MPITTALSDISCERARQIQEEGWSHAHDDKHIDGSLAQAAAYYAAPEWIPSLWPSFWDRDRDTPKRNKHDRRRQLVIAGALILAEIERLDRAKGESS